jgi:5-methylcytosine-specific restriction protein A
VSLYREHISKGLGRSGNWAGVRRAHLDRQPFCQACGRTNRLEVHHIRDYSTYPELELDMGNLITLCGGGTRCHFVFGHLGNWGSINPDIVEDAIVFRNKILNRRSGCGVNGIGLLRRLEDYFYEILYRFWER